MDDYRHLLKNTHVVPIGSLMDAENPCQDDQIVSIAGVVQTVKMKTTRNNSMMAYVTLEDDTASIEMLAFSNVLSQYGGFLKENQPVVITGRISMRDDKEPQLVINRARPMSDFAEAESAHINETLYLRLPSEESELFHKVRSIISMFPGDNQVIVYFEDTKKKRGSKCTLDGRMLDELIRLLGKENVVIK